MSPKLLLRLLRYVHRRSWSFADQCVPKQERPNPQEMLDFCGQHNLTADVEVIPIQKINEAYERMVKSDVK